MRLINTPTSNFGVKKFVRCKVTWCASKVAQYKNRRAVTSLCTGHYGRLPTKQKFMLSRALQIQEQELVIKLEDEAAEYYKSKGG